MWLYIICLLECACVCIYLNQCWECERPQLKWAGHQSPSSRRQGLVICGCLPFLFLSLSLSPPPPYIPHPASPASNWPGSTAGHAVLHGLDEVIISRPLTTSKINSFWNGHNGGLTRRDISIISSSPPLSSFSPLGTGRVWFIPGLMGGGDLGAQVHQPTSAVLQACSPNRTNGRGHLRKADRVFAWLVLETWCEVIIIYIILEFHRFTACWGLSWNLNGLCCSLKRVCVRCGVL